VGFVLKSWDLLFVRFIGVHFGFIVFKGFILELWDYGIYFGFIGSFYFGDLWDLILWDLYEIR